MTFDLEIFDEEIISKDNIVYFYFECKRCGERWCGTFCQCPHCRRVRKFRILDGIEAEEQYIQTMIKDRIHFVMLVGDK